MVARQCEDGVSVDQCVSEMHSANVASMQVNMCHDAPGGAKLWEDGVHGGQYVFIYCVYSVNLHQCVFMCVSLV